MDIERRKLPNRIEGRPESPRERLNWVAGEIASFHLWFIRTGLTFQWFAFDAATARPVGEGYSRGWEPTVAAVGAGILPLHRWEHPGRRVRDRRLVGLAERVRSGQLPQRAPEPLRPAALDLGWVWLLAIHHRGDHFDVVAADPITYTPYQIASASSTAEAIERVLSALAPPALDVR